MLKSKKFLKKITIFLIAFAFLFFPFKPSLNALNEDNSSSEKYDYVLIIDESGSMRTNDPSNMRVDAARLFIYLSEMLSKGNRVLLAGFGEKTNIYLPLTEISGNEDAINAAIKMIQSNQKYTDMKGALADIKKVLGQRIDKQKTAVIFLTDGALTIDDIPPEAAEDQTVENGKEKPGRTKTGDDVQNENPGSITGQQGETDNQENSGSGKIGSTGKGENQYLEKYKKELLDLCYSYKRDNIVIYPIAFTQEAEIKLLEQMASITSGACWRAEKATDIRNIFLEILKNITSRFLKIEEQKDSSAISGEFEITKDVKELVLIATASDFESKPKINVISSSSEKPLFDKVIEEKGFKIVQVISPEEGKWSYEINGDGVFVYDMVSSNIIEPKYPIYLSDTSIPLKIKLGDTLEDSSSLKSSDFKITCSVEDPEGMSVDDVNLSDDGKGMDDSEGDGIFSGVFNKTDIKGNYNAVFSMQHVPTNSTSTKKINFEVIKLPVTFKVLEPLESFYISGKKIPIKVQLSSDPDTDSNGSINFAEYQITCTIFYPDGKKTEGLMLLDNGQSFDEKSSDGIFSASVTDSSVNGAYTIKFYIQHTPTMNASADTTSMVKFKVAEISEIEAKIETSPITGESAKVMANFLDFSNSSFKYILTKPGGTVVEGEMLDSGESGDADFKKDDGIYSAVLEKLDELGEYKLLIKSSYSGDSVSSEPIPVEKEVKFNKEYKVVVAFTEVPLRINSTEEEVKFSIRIISKSSSESAVSIDENKLKSEPSSSLASLVIETDSEKIKANSDNEVKFILKLKENSKAGKYSFKIPLVIDGKYPTGADIDVELATSFPWYLKIIVIGVSVLAAVAIFLFVYFLYIKPKRASF
jgi:hypothetical protein